MIFINKIKKMKYTIILLFVLLLVTKEDLGDNYTINTFLKYLQENGYYEVINEVKCEISTDVAIEFCEILTESPHCEEVVRIYMTCIAPAPPIYHRARSHSPSPSPDFKLISILDKYQIPKNKFKKLIIKLRFGLIIKKVEKFEPIIIDKFPKEKLINKFDD